jgi:hypothetical protein
VTYGIKSVTALLYPYAAPPAVPGIERTTLDDRPTLVADTIEQREFVDLGRTGCRTRGDDQASNDEDEKRREARKHGGKQE